MALVARLLLRQLLLMEARIVRLQQPLISLLCCVTKERITLCWNALGILSLF